MDWKTPKILEVQVGREISMYACAACKQLRQYLRGRGENFDLLLGGVGI
jgi:coenzyme PQQ precursor peptide PqqA